MSTAKIANPNGPTTIWNKNFICVMVANTLMCFGHFSVNPLVVSYTEFLGTSKQMAGFLAGMFFGVAFAIRPISGPMITKMDKRFLLILTFICGLIANLGYAFFRSVAAFSVFRFLNGLEYSFLGTLVMTLASDNLPIEKMASGMGIYTLGSAVATAVSPTIGTILLEFGTAKRDEAFGFMIVFLYAALALALSIIPAVMLSPDRKTKEEVAGLGVWYKNIITKHAIPIAVVLLMVQAAYSLYNNYIIEFGKEQGIANISLFFTVLAIALAVSRPLSGVLTDKFGVQKIIIPGLIVFAVSYFVVSSSTTLFVVLFGAVLVAFGFGFSQPPLVAMSMLTEQPLKRGVASNTIYMGLDLGLFLGPVLGGFMRERYGFVTMFNSAAAPIAIAFVGFILILPMYRRRRKELESENLKSLSEQ